jgi:hypothetical protein
MRSKRFDLPLLRGKKLIGLAALAFALTFAASGHKVMTQDEQELAAAPASVGSSVVDVGSGGVIMDVPGLGRVSDAGFPCAVMKNNKLRITAYNNFIEWSLEYGSPNRLYRQGEVQPGKFLDIEYQWYLTQQLVIARPVAGRMGSMKFRLNDCRVVALWMTTP